MWQGNLTDMASLTRNLAQPIYAEEDHHTWARLCERQMVLVRDHACRQFLDGFPKLGLDPKRLPDAETISARIEGMTGWMPGNAQNAYLGPTEWFEHLAERRFPVTDYIRRPHELDFTPNPDLFHEYFGHLAFFADQEFADDAYLFGKLYLTAQNERQQLEIARLWWYTTEFGFVRENGQLKVYGAGLFSSPGEFLHSMKPETPKAPFDIRRVADTPGAVYTMHDLYFIIEGQAHVRSILQDYARMEGLPIPTL
jgi:phenylalanine-4-hydroxylase